MKKIKKMFSLSPKLKNRESVLNKGYEFSYSLPTMVISYPRSGSNFLQSVLDASSGLPHRSFHNPQVNMRELSHYGLKSHAISPEWLADEFNRTTLNYKYPEKIIYVYRDPRDVMISFYEYVQHIKGVVIDQSKFLENVSYVYATYSDIHPVLGRKNSMEPMSVVDGYRLHYDNWMCRKKSQAHYLVKYEDLLTCPESTFKGVFDYLELECDLDSNALSKKVSQYDYGNRVRGEVCGWKKNAEKYAAMIDSVNDLLKDEIKYLSY